MKKFAFVLLSVVGLFLEGAHLVTNNNDSGLGSFRQAVIDSNNDGGSGVEFDAGYTITLLTNVDITEDCIIDGTGGGGSVTIEGAPGVELIFPSNNLVSNDGPGIFTIGTEIKINSNILFRKQGLGTVAFSGQSAGISGEIRITQGELLLENSNALTGASRITLYPNTTLGLGSGVTIAEEIIFDFPGAQTIDVASGAATLSGVVKRNPLIFGGSLNKTGGGELVLSGANTYENGTTLSAGQITLANLTALGDASGALSMADTTKLAINPAISSPNNISLAVGTEEVEVSSGTGTLSGVISGDGELEKTGGGELALSGANTYAGGTTLSAGQITLANNTALGDSSGALSMADTTTLALNGGITSANNISMAAGTTTVDVSTGTGTLSGVISGSGTFQKAGTGTLVLSGANTYTGDLSIDSGACTINGSFAGDISVPSGAMFGGSGAIGGTVTIQSGGELTPGNSIGTITIGDLTLDPGSITNIEFSPTANSFINVTNTADVEGTLNLTAQTGHYDLSGSYEILSAGVLIDTFQSITGTNIDQFTFELQTVGTSIFLNYTYQRANISTLALGGNDEIVVNYLNDYAPHSPEFSALANLDGQELIDAIYSVSPARNAFGPFVTQQTVFSLSHVVNDYLENRRFLNAHSSSSEMVGALLPFYHDLLADEEDREIFLNTKQEKPEINLWASGFIDFAHQDKESENVAFDFMSEGVVIGIDYSKPTRPVLGLALGYAHSQTDDYQSMGRSDISYYFASLFMEQSWEYLYVQLGFWGVYHQIYNVRNIVYADIDRKATGTISGCQVDPHIEVGGMIRLKPTDIEPYVSFDYVYNWEESLHEKGAGLLNANQKAQQSSMLQSKAGIKFYQMLELKSCNMGFKEGLSYISRIPYNTGKVTAAIFGASEFMTLTSFTDAQNLGAINAVYLVEFGEKRDYLFSLGYEGQFGSQYTFNELLLNFTKTF